MTSAEQIQAYRELYDRSPQLDALTLMAAATQRTDRWYGEVWRNDDESPLLMECCDAIDKRSAMMAALNSAAEIMKAFLRIVGEANGASDADGVTHREATHAVIVEVAASPAAYRAAVALCQRLWSEQ